MYTTRKEEELNTVLIGKTVKKIFMNQEFLRFETDQGNVVFTVEGDCCSYSYLHDIFGVKKLLENGPILEFKEVALREGDYNYVPIDYEGDYCVKCYGYAIVTNSEKWGEQTTAFSFRNKSNGYYGGSLKLVEGDRDVSPEITDDVLEIE